MNENPETCEAVERWQQGKINIFDEMARLERERDEARAERDEWIARFRADERLINEAMIPHPENPEP